MTIEEGGPRLPDGWERGVGPLEGSTHHARVTGPCGDTMEVWLKAESGRVAKAAVYTDGCDTSLLCALTACFWSEGRSLEEVGKTRAEDLLEELKGLPEASRHCAVLAAWTLREAATGVRENPPPEAGDPCS